MGGALSSLANFNLSHSPASLLRSFREEKEKPSKLKLGKKKEKGAAPSVATDGIDIQDWIETTTLEVRGVGHPNASHLLFLTHLHTHIQTERTKG